MERKFVKSSNYLLNSHPELAVLMANQIDRDGRTPVLVAKEINDSELIQKLTVFMRGNNVSFRYGVKQDTTEVDLLESYSKFGCAEFLE